MKELVELAGRLLAKYKHFVLYSIIGAFSASLDFLVYTLLVKYLIINYLVSNTVSVNCGIIASFLLNRHFNFKVKDRAGLRFAIFYSVGLLGLLVSSGLLVVLVEWWSMNAIAAKMLTIVAVVLVQFSLNKYVTFKKTNRQ